MNSVLIVSSSRLVWGVLRRIIVENPNLSLVDYSSKGQDVLNKISNNDPGLVIIDLNSEGLDGTNLIQRITRQYKKPIILVGEEGKDKHLATFSALEAGAVDFITMPVELEDNSDFILFKKNLLDKLSIALVSRPREILSGRKKLVHRFKKTTDKIVMIGASTGGPSTIKKLFSELPGNLPFSILVVQHMPKGFTKSFSERLNKTSDFLVKEAEEGEILEENTAYICPADYHMAVVEQGKETKISLNQSEKIKGNRPSYDFLAKSVASLFKERTIMVVLTGMGKDGTEGAAKVRENNGVVLAESEESCIIYGMPKSVMDKNLASRVVSLDKLPVSIVQEVEK